MASDTVNLHESVHGVVVSVYVRILPVISDILAWAETMAWAPKQDECVYTSCYCEENVWKLCEQFEKRSGDTKQLYVVFISSHERQTALWNLKCGGTADFQLWDYHVILIKSASSDKESSKTTTDTVTGIREHENESLVYDLDTSLPFPVCFNQYTKEVLRPELILHFRAAGLPERLFRVIPADIFLEEFASDRSHMRKEDGTWLALPPPYPPIRSQKSSNNIQEFISMKNSSAPGVVMAESEFLHRFQN